MTIIIKNKDTLIYDEFKFKCCVGKNGFTKDKIEGDKRTPTGNLIMKNYLEMIINMIFLYQLIIITIELNWV